MEMWCGCKHSPNVLNNIYNRIQLLPVVSEYNTYYDIIHIMTLHAMIIVSEEVTTLSKMYQVSFQNSRNYKKEGWVGSIKPTVDINDTRYYASLLELSLSTPIFILVMWYFAFNELTHRHKQINPTPQNIFW